MNTKKRKEQIFLGLLELCKWKRNKVKKFVLGTNYYYGKNREYDDYCHNSNSNPTQLKSWVLHENNFRQPAPPPITTHHHHKLIVINISAVPDPISAKL